MNKDKIKKCPYHIYNRCRSQTIDLETSTCTLACTLTLQVTRSREFGKELGELCVSYRYEYRYVANISDLII